MIESFSRKGGHLSRLWSNFPNLSLVNQAFTKLMNTLQCKYVVHSAYIVVNIHHTAYRQHSSSKHSALTSLRVEVRKGEGGRTYTQMSPKKQMNVWTNNQKHICVNVRQIIQHVPWSCLWLFPYIDHRSLIL